MIVVIVGPTGVGKTRLSIELAKALDGEIINADSTQVYKGLDIATAKVTEEEKQQIPHHLFDIKEIQEDYTVYNYQQDARKWINDILKRGKVPILVGGTGLYIKSALYNYQFNEEKLQFDYSMYTSKDLYDKLCAIDPTTKIHPNNRRRIERALSFYQINKKLITDKNDNTLLYNACFIGLTTDRDYLYKRINRRVDLMLEHGLIIEAKKLYDSNIRTKAVLTPIGYKELFAYFDGLTTKEEAVALIKQNSRKYAKRQYTYFNHQLPTKWFDVDFENFNKTVTSILDYIAKL